MNDPILYWNNVALEANRRDFSNLPGTDKPVPEQPGPTLSSRALAIVHLAMYDAYAGAKNSQGGDKFERYDNGQDKIDDPAVRASPDAAVAAAAHACLSALFPRQKPHFDFAYYNTQPTDADAAQGLLFGRDVAIALLKKRKTDSDARADGYVYSLLPEKHRPDPANPDQVLHAPYYSGGGTKCFSVSQRHILEKPPQREDAEYLKALKQVRSKGIAIELMGTLPATTAAEKKGIDLVPRTPEQTLTGLFWAYDGVREIGTPPRLYNQILREVATKKNNSIADNARLFALVNAAMADAGILAWQNKYLYNVWRPVIGVREHDGSMGPAAPSSEGAFNPDCDPAWLPMGAPASNSRDRNFTPPFPAYPSGHAAFGAAALHMARLFYTKGAVNGKREKDDVFTGPFVSDELNGRTTDNQGTVRPRHVRRFPDGLWGMILENALSRVYLGVHWLFDAYAIDASGDPDWTRMIGGVPLGLKIAEDIYARSGDGNYPPKTVA